MSVTSVQAARQAVVRDRVLEGAATLLADGEALTFARVAKVAAVPERTVYRHFPTREALLTELFAWANERIGFTGPRARTRAELQDSVRRTFVGFDELAPVVRGLLAAPDGLWARLSENADRQRAAMAVVRNEAPGLGRTTERRVAATVQLLTSAAAWQTLRDYWQMDGTEAANTVALALDLLLDAAAARSPRHPT
jgi:AcrR family transcriptional regulator